MAATTAIDPSTKKQSSVDTLERIFEGLEKMGDLPIFSASVNQIRVMSSRQETGTLELAGEIMKDTNLTSKLIRVSNSSYYNRGNKIAMVSRSIVLLGFDTVKSITLAMKVIDSFNHNQSGVDLNTLLVRSYMSAGFAREIAQKCKVKDPEESYVCSLMHNFGEIIIAAILPDEYEKITHLVVQNRLPQTTAQKSILGMSFDLIAKHVLEKWEFSDSITKTLGNAEQIVKGPVRDKIKLNHALASLGNSIMDSMYAPLSVQKSYNVLMAELAESTGLKSNLIATCLDKSFEMSCNLAEKFGLDKKILAPKIIGNRADPRNKVAQKLKTHADKIDEHFMVASDEIPVEQLDKPNRNPENSDNFTPASNTENNTVSTKKPDSTEKKDANPSNSDKLVQILHNLTMQITQQDDLNKILNTIIDGIISGVGFNNAALCFVNKENTQYKARFCSGPNADRLKTAFSSTINVKSDIFSKIMLTENDVIVNDANDIQWKSLIAPAFLTAIKTKSFTVAPIRWGNKPLGFFYADRSPLNNIPPDMYRGFVQLVAQAKLALNIRSRMR